MTPYQIKLQASTALTYRNGQGHEKYITTVISDRPLFKKEDTDWKNGSLNSRIQNAINNLLILQTGAKGQNIGFCAERYPLPNDKGDYIYKFESRCDHSG